MTKLFWYVFGKFGRNFGLCLVTVLTIYLIVDFFEKLRKFLKYDADLTVMLSFFLYRIPEIMYLLAPLGALMASIITVGSLNRTREITAMRSCGLSFNQIAFPFLAFGGIASLIALLLTGIFVPLANLQAEYVKLVLIKKKPEPLSLSPEGLWLRLGREQLIQIDSVKEDGTYLEGIHHYSFREPLALREIFEAKGALYAQNRWHMEKVIHRTLSEDGEIHVRHYPFVVLPLSFSPEDFRNWFAQSPEHMTLPQLHDYVEQMRTDGNATQQFLTDYWARIAYAFVPFIMTLLGISIALRNTGGRVVGVAKGLGQTLAIGFLFWAVHSVGIVLGRNGAILPIIGSWIATIMFLMIGTNFFLRLR